MTHTLTPTNDNGVLLLFYTLRSVSYAELRQEHVRLRFNALIHLYIDMLCTCCCSPNRCVCISCFWDIFDFTYKLYTLYTVTHDILQANAIRCNHLFGFWTRIRQWSMFEFTRYL